jgi:hypothetical protein
MAIKGNHTQESEKDKVMYNELSKMEFVYMAYSQDISEP